GLAASWLERAGERDALRLAEHCDRGGVIDEAIVWYRRAATQAIEASDYARSIDLAERAIDCGATGPALAALLAIMAEAERRRGGNAAAVAVGTRALAMLPRGSPLWCAGAAWVPG